MTQPLILKCDFLVSKVCFHKRVNLYRYDMDKMLMSVRATSMDDIHFTMDQLIERKMRQEIIDKQKAALAGKAFVKEWDYAKYENRIRRITPQLKEVEGINLDQVTFAKYKEEEALNKTRGGSKE